MHINRDIVKGKWSEIKGEIQKTWGRITNDEIEKTKGDLTSIAGLVRQKYGVEREKFDQKFSEIVAPFEKKKDEKMKNIKGRLKT